MELTGKDNNSPRSWNLHSYIQHHNLAPLLGGLSGGSVSTITLYPLDLIKVRMQVNEQPYHIFSKKKNLKEPQINLKQPSVYSRIRRVVQKEGMVGLYQGLSPALVGSAVSWGGYFYAYESLKRILIQQKVNRQNKKCSEENNHVNSDQIKLGHAENFTAACTAGAILVLITNPIWLVKTRLQLQNRELDARNLNVKLSKVKITKPYTGISNAFQTIVKEEGPLALYKGAVPAMLLVSHGGVQFVTYEFLKHKFGNYTRAKRSNHIIYQHENISPFGQLWNSMGYLTMGAVSKMIASTVTYPLQVIKSRLQQRSESGLSHYSNAKLNTKAFSQGEVQPYTGVIDCVKRMWINEGIHGFFKGCVPNAIRVAPSAAITFVVYESVMDLLVDKDNY